MSAVKIERDIIMEELFEILSELQPDDVSEAGKRDKKIKNAVNSIMGYLRSAPLADDQSAYPNIGVHRS